MLTTAAQETQAGRTARDEPGGPVPPRQRRRLPSHGLQDCVGSDAAVERASYRQRLWTRRIRNRHDQVTVAPIVRCRLNGLQNRNLSLSKPVYPIHSRVPSMLFRSRIPWLATTTGYVKMEISSAPVSLELPFNQRQTAV